MISDFDLDIFDIVCVDDNSSLVDYFSSDKDQCPNKQSSLLLRNQDQETPLSVY